MAVARDTVSSEWGRMKTRYALAYVATPAPLPSTAATVASLASRFTIIAASWVSST